MTLAILIALGAVECSLVLFDGRDQRVLAGVSHAMLLAAMAVMVIAPQRTDVIVVALASVLVATLVGKSRQSIHLIGCSLASLALVAAMRLEPPSSMPGMPGMTDGPAGVVRALAWLAVAVFFSRAVIEGSLVLRRAKPDLAQRAGAIAGSLAMVVMCAAMAGGA
jgi:hypothetical protein